MTAGADRWIRWATIACVAVLALIAGTVPYSHMHALVVKHGQPCWVTGLTPFSVDGMMVAASTTLLAALSADRGYSDGFAGQRVRAHARAGVGYHAASHPPV